MDWGTVFSVRINKINRIDDGAENPANPVNPVKTTFDYILDIPLAAYDYVVNGKSAIEWVMERYQVTTNKNSGIDNDPNKWLEESDN